MSVDVFWFGLASSWDGTRDGFVENRGGATDVSGIGDEAFYPNDSGPIEVVAHAGGEIFAITMFNASSLRPERPTWCRVWRKQSPTPRLRIGPIGPVPPAGFEPAHPAPEAGALSPELRGPKDHDCRCGRPDSSIRAFGLSGCTPSMP